MVTVNWGEFGTCGWELMRSVVTVDEIDVPVAGIYYARCRQVRSPRFSFHSSSDLPLGEYFISTRALLLSSDKYSTSLTSRTPPLLLIPPTFRHLHSTKHDQLRLPIATSRCSQPTLHHNKLLLNTRNQTAPTSHHSHNPTSPIYLSLPIRIGERI